MWTTYIFFIRAAQILPAEELLLDAGPVDGNTHAQDRAAQLEFVGALELDSENINTWKNGVERALKKYMPNGAEASGQKCPNCGAESLIYQEGCLICKSCGSSKCG